MAVCHAESEMTLDDILRIYEKGVHRQDSCQHRWEQTFFGQRYWEPGTWQYSCARCGKMSMTTLEKSDETIS